MLLAADLRRVSPTQSPLTSFLLLLLSSPPQGLYQEVTDLRFRVTDMENERVQCEKKLKATRVSVRACVCVHAHRS